MGNVAENAAVPNVELIAGNSHCGGGGGNTTALGTRVRCPDWFLITMPNSNRI